MVKKEILLTWTGIINTCERAPTAWPGTVLVFTLNGLLLEASMLLCLCMMMEKGVWAAEADSPLV